jgi:serine phosphatase RsbU (regulator of sigma subunit)
MPERLKITMGIRLLLALGILSLFALSGIGVWSLRSQMLEHRQTELRKLLDLSLSVARAAMIKAGGPASEAGQKSFFEVLQSARFGEVEEQNYIFAYDYDGFAKAHADPKRLGQNRIDVVYANGVKVIKALIDIARSPAGFGFIEYPVEKGVGGPFKPKLSLIQNVPEIGALVGVGAYIDDLDADFYRQLILEGALVAAVVAAIGAAGFLIGRRLMAVTSEMEHQLAAAIALQRDMLPSSEQLAEIQAACPLDLSSYYKPLDGIGGDIWGTEVIGPQRIMIYIADFTGHGVSAALNTARFHSFVHTELQGTDEPALLLRRLNDRLHAVLPTGQFATMFCATMDLHMQTIEYASAGAPPQLYRRSSADQFEVISQPSLPLGILLDVAYVSQTVAFHPGGELVIYTDGLVETPKPPRNLYTTESLREFLNKAKPGTSLQLCDHLLGKLCKPAIKPDDDITVVIAKHTGGELRDYGGIALKFLPHRVHQGH